MCAKIKVGITQGDAAGIGPEVVAKALEDPRMAELCTPAVYKYGGTFEPGAPTSESGAVAVKALKDAVADLRKGAIDVVVTGPISKANSRSDDFPYEGHTEFMAAEFGGSEGATPLMMMCSHALRVALVTSHIAIADVPEAISKQKIVDKLRILDHRLKADFGVVAPRIAVLALNPHAGEGGMMGTDEAEVIKPAVDQAYGEGILAFGPLPADGLFVSGEYRKYDALLAMYHDQGLAPFKALAPDGVNFTAGLPVIRTSPDHGTAFDIAGRDEANADSMRNAIYMAVDIHRNRAAYAEMTRNPLKHYERERGDERTIDFSKSEM
ncbi:MAG: 4-hydroxythreonine-4-phosphate dehydrogenase PdxA [Alistipes sp.]|jgi:4-hydroxythreonine-4-phosphate dehydrogenase|nr:4-hydroxythreonine-4-phosphate dehydrogenase PdxA [Alistipes sp.]